MRHLKIYENFITNYFAKKRLEKFVIAFDKVLDSNEETRNLVWRYENNCVILCAPSYRTETIGVDYMSITQLSFGIRINLKFYNIKEDMKVIFDFFRSVLDKYFEDETDYNDYYNIYLIKNGSEKFLKDITPEEFELYKNINKYNL